MEYQYYYCDINSVAGRRVRSFWHKAQIAAEKADAYAKNYGATSYVQPVQYFEGGVEYLEFDRTPDLKVWRKKYSLDGREQYEPNCDMRMECLVIPDKRFRPSDTWDCVFSRELLEWKDAQPLFPLEYWAKAANVSLSDDRDADKAVIDLELRNRYFILYREFYNDALANNKKALHHAVRAEKDRQSLPVVATEELYNALEQQQPTNDEERKAYNDSPTPLFFFYGSRCYIRVCLPCKAQGLHTIAAAKFTNARLELEAEQRMKQAKKQQ